MTPDAHEIIRRLKAGEKLNHVNCPDISNRIHTLKRHYKMKFTKERMDVSVKGFNYYLSDVDVALNKQNERLKGWF